MSGDDRTVEIFREIRDEIRTTNANLGARIDATNDRLDTGFGALSSRIDETNRRLDAVDTTLKDLAGQQVILNRYVKNLANRHEALEDRVDALETAAK